jgi:hypothetical protein
VGDVIVFLVARIADRFTEGLATLSVDADSGDVA